jgi:hypothetical protein
MNMVYGIVRLLRHSVIRNGVWLILRGVLLIAEVCIVVRKGVVLEFISNKRKIMNESLVDLGMPAKIAGMEQELVSVFTSGFLASAKALCVDLRCLDWCSGNPDYYIAKENRVCSAPTRESCLNSLSEKGERISGCAQCKYACEKKLN